MLDCGKTRIQSHLGIGGEQKNPQNNSDIDADKKNNNNWADVFNFGKKKD